MGKKRACSRACRGGERVFHSGDCAVGDFQGLFSPRKTPGETEWPLLPGSLKTWPGKKSEWPRPGTSGGNIPAALAKRDGFSNRSRRILLFCSKIRLYSVRAASYLGRSWHRAWSKKRRRAAAPAFRTRRSSGQNSTVVRMPLISPVGPFFNTIQKQLPGLPAGEEKSPQALLPGLPGHIPSRSANSLPNRMSSISRRVRKDRPVDK